jgi:CRISPR-associated endonuclease/helicase Cas3
LKPSLLDIYYKLKGGYFFGKPRDRSLLDEVLEIIEEQVVSDFPSLTFIQLPPGYGKTAVPFSLALWSILNNEVPIERSIDVLPLRSIVEDVNVRFTGYGQNGSEPRGLRAFGISKEDAENISGAQCMFIHGSPFLQKNGFIGTTLDTFTLLASKLPPLEISKISREYMELYGHYEIARGAILSSITVFDEVHLFFEEHRGPERALEALIALMVALLEWHIPIVMMTATLPSSWREEIREWIKSYVPETKFNVLEYGHNDKVDHGFEEEVRSTTLRTKIEKSEDEYINLIRQASSSYNRILVVTNTVRRSLDLYNKLEDLEPVLLHAEFTQGDRVNKLNELKENKWLCISTQVIEAGIDISSDALFTDIAPICSIVQRTGRCCRPSHKHAETGEIVICMSTESINAANKVYDENRVMATGEKLINVSNDFCWHSYLDYFPLIEKIYSECKPDFRIGRTFNHLLDIFENPYFESTDALDYLLELGSFTRNSPLMSAIICERGEIKELKDLWDRLNFMIPIEEDGLGKIRKKSEVRMLLRKENGKIEERPAHEKSMKDVVRNVLRGKILGFGISNEMYDRKRGLKLWA